MYFAPEVLPLAPLDLSMLHHLPSVLSYTGIMTVSLKKWTRTVNQPNHLETQDTYRLKCLATSFA